ncbi:hypothetical protein LTR84_011607 [Exophiala bonariae]|uniref:Transcription factor domain-containing protein n=1 Tax=Exophiala bonariae TaxID=1690606 RepID=A0AAV9NGG5_9EURO|nr:hypothetical protein LTR84_011607 [Exophiala bonariae]
MYSIESAHQHAISGFRPDGTNRHQTPLMANPETLVLVMDHLVQIPFLTFQGQTSAFAHAQILSTVNFMEDSSSKSDDTPTSVYPAILSHPELERQIRELLSLDIQDLKFTEFLARIHVLIAVVFASVFSLQSSGNTLADFPLLDHAIKLLHRWEQHFKIHLPEHLSSDLSPWQAWVIAESCRRTFLALQWITGMVELCQSGYCSYQPFVESLPFDARTGLWEAETEAEWNSALEAHRRIELDPNSSTANKPAESSLVSWCEFIESAGPSPRPRFDGMLQRLLLVAYYGKETQLPVDLQASSHPKFRMPDNITPA